MDTCALLKGYFPSDFPDNNANEAEKVVVGQGHGDAVQLSAKNSPSVTVHDARVLQEGPALSSLSREKAALLFHAKGFCCLPHETAVQDWNEDYMQGMLCKGALKGVGSDISNIYGPEVEELIRNVLLRDYNVVEVVLNNAVLRRGPGSKNDFYGSGVHQDYGLSMEDYKASLASFDSTGYMVKAVETKYQNPQVTGMMVINFWRPILNYTRDQPLLTKPLAVCDPSSVETADTVHTGLDAGEIHGQAGTLTDQMGLRHRPQHQWYYYPRMHNEEVLAFKQFELWKGDPEDRTRMPVRGCFHTAFDDPNTPVDAPARTSCEYRVTVYLGAPKTAEEVAKQKPWVGPTPLWPKQPSEWAKFPMDVGGVVCMIVIACTSTCSTIPDLIPYLLTFGAVTLVSNLHKFIFSLDRPGHAKQYPLPKALASLLGILQLCVGIWGITVMAPNLHVFADAGPSTCELGPMIAGVIPAAIIAVVIFGLLIWGLFSCARKTCAPKRIEPEL